MKNNEKKLYEGMFLIDPALAAGDWDGIIKKITNMLERADAEIVSLKKWDERKLAYKIRGKTRGTYILSYFKAPGTKIRDIESRAQLSEDIMRVLILKTDKMSQEDIEKETPVMKAERKKSKAEKKTETKTEKPKETDQKEEKQNDEQNEQIKTTENSAEGENEEQKEPAEENTQ